MSDKINPNLDAITSFAREAAMNPGGVIRPGPGEEAITSLEVAMVQGRVKSVPGGRHLAFSVEERGWLRKAHRAGSLDSVLERFTGDVFPVSPNQWPAADLVFEVVDLPVTPVRSLVRVEVRQTHPRPVRLSVFEHQMVPDAWFAIEPFTIDHEGIRDFERRVTVPRVDAALALLTIVTDAALAAKAIADRHQHRIASRR